MSLYLKPDRSQFIPKGATKISDKASSAVAYLYQFNGRPYALTFAGKQQKPAWHYRFQSEAHREKRVTEFFAGVRAREGLMTKRREERKAWVNDYKVGEIVGTCWGYDQTNREYYEIVGVRGKKVTLRRIGEESYATGDMTGVSAPLPGSYRGEPFARLATANGIKIDRVATAWRVAFKEVAGVKVYQGASWSSYA